MSVSFSAASRTSAAPLPTTDVRSGGPTSAELLDFVTRVAADSALIARLPVPEQGRAWMRLEGPDGSEAWLIGWPPGAETGWHDHGGSRGAFATAAGELAEESVAVPLPASGWRSLELADDVDRTRRLPAGSGRAFGAHHVHQVVNASEDLPAVSVHAYYPPLPLMRRYSRQGRTLRLALVERPEAW